MKQIGELVPRSIGIIQPMLLFFAVLISRLLIKYLLTIDHSLKNKKKNVLIYGAGSAGQQLVIALENNPEFKVIGFLDDDKKLESRVLFGKTIYSSEALRKIIKIKDINIVFLAIPSISRNKRSQIIQKLNKFKLTVKTLPSISQIIDGRITFSDIEDFNIEDLLNREQVEPNHELLKKNINFKSVLVTGAGGSIGSELCRQIIRLQPEKLILIELNEFALYEIYEQLLKIKKNVKVVPLLLNTLNQEKLKIVFETFKVDTIYHAAAYKHVPLVEENVCEGVMNNVFSTQSVAKAAVKKQVSNFVLISSDKAVRPTNIMGATKKLAELTVQGICCDGENSNTKFSIVRFGNVLESSGSVIPLFKKQIKDGGPITLTHKDVTRYFMTTTEAAQLTIQAGAMGSSNNAEIFLLDMGESIKIYDMVLKMILLSGLTIKNSKNPDGDIEILTIGLRPGEKLYEELLIGNNPQETKHSKIKKTIDSFIPLSQLNKELDKLERFIATNDVIEVKKLLKQLIKLYQPNSKIVDHLYNERLKIKSN